MTGLDDATPNAGKEHRPRYRMTTVAEAESLGLKVPDAYRDGDLLLLATLVVGVDYKPIPFLKETPDGPCVCDAAGSPGVQRCALTCPRRTSEHVPNSDPCADGGSCRCPAGDADCARGTHSEGCWLR